MRTTATSSLPPSGRALRSRRKPGSISTFPNLAAYYLYVQFNLGVDQLAKNMLVRTWDGVMWWITYYDGDCQLGSDNKSFLTGKYDDNRQTKRDGAYVMQGHNSWLWNLILGNMGNLLEDSDDQGCERRYQLHECLQHPEGR